jgi:hypothetical protein
MPGHSSLPCADCVNLFAMQRICKERDVDGREGPGHDGRVSHFKIGGYHHGPKPNPNPNGNGAGA